MPLELGNLEPKMEDKLVQVVTMVMVKSLEEAGMER